MSDNKPTLIEDSRIMRQFAMNITVAITQNETLADYLNAILMDKPTWKVVALNHILSNGKNKILTGPPEPIQLITVVFESPEADMPTVENTAG